VSRRHAHDDDSAARPDTWRLLRPFLARHVGALVGAGLSTIALTAASLAAPWPLKFAVDALAERAGEVPFELGAEDLRQVALLVGLVLAIAAVGALASYFSEFWLNRAGEQIVHELRVATYAQLQRLSLSFHTARSKGDLVTHVTGDVNAVGYLFAESLGTLASAVLLLGGMFAVCLVLDPLLTVAAFLVAPPLFGVIRYYQRKVKSAAKRQRAMEGEIASLANETLSAMPVVKAFGTEDFEQERIERSSRARLAVGVQVSRLDGRFSGIVEMLGAVSTALVLGLGVFSVARGSITPGDLVVFVSYSTKLYRPLRDIAKQSTRIARAMARLDRIGEILHCDEVLTSHGSHAPGRARGEVHLDHVSFGYSRGGPVLDDVDLRVPAGRRVALVGASGAGKSTIGALVARFYDPTAGRVLLDGRDAREYSLEWLRDQVGMLLQDTILFSGTVAENIAYGREAPLDQIHRAAELAGAAGFVESLTDGYDTLLGPGGVDLSGGERQRIGIARVLLRDPPVLVLDEPTSGLDAAMEAHVLTGIDSLMRGRTTLMITHSMALASVADLVAVLQDGRLVELGDPATLLARDSQFRRMLTTQQVAADVRTGA
jgi:ABC-type multidrug transport system fused ATPase/permease subunit